jgi:hypothetical protein
MSGILYQAPSKKGGNISMQFSDFHATALEYRDPAASVCWLP